MGRSAWAAACGAFVSFSAASAGAQTAAPPLPPPPLFVASPLTLPHVPQLRLTFPIHPLSVSFTQQEVTGYVAPLPLFRYEALWLDRPRLQLLTATTAERAYELDCTLTCQPVVSHAVELEARLPLPGLSAAIPKTYLFARGSSYYNAQSARPVGLIRAGFAGFLSF